jgi:hypothetical protein
VLGEASARLTRRATAGHLDLTAVVTTAPGADLTQQDVTVALRAGGTVIYQRTIPAGALLAKGAGKRFVYRERAEVAVRSASLVLRRDAADPARYHLRMQARGIDPALIPASIARAQLAVVVGEERFATPLSCADEGAASVTVCAP